MFEPRFWPFWLISFGLSAVAWTCLGRFLLGFFVRVDSPNYIWRAFRLITDWAVLATAFVTPRAMPGLMLAPLAAMWVFLVRLAIVLTFAYLGLVPTLGVMPTAP